MHVLIALANAVAVVAFFLLLQAAERQVKKRVKSPVRREAVIFGFWFAVSVTAAILGQWFIMWLAFFVVVLEAALIVRYQRRS